MMRGLLAALLGLAALSFGAASAQAASVCSPFAGFPFTTNLGSAPNSGTGESALCFGTKVQAAFGTLGQPNGLAGLDATGRLPAAKLPLAGDASGLSVTPNVTGAVARPFSEWFKDLVSALSLGVVDASVNPTFDNSTVLQAAIDQATTLKRAVYLPGGTYLACNLTLRKGMHLVGSGRAPTTIKRGPTCTGNTFIVSENGTTDEVVLEDLTIDGGASQANPASTYNANAITLDVYGSRPQLRRLTILNAPGTALRTRYTVNDDTGGPVGTFDTITIDRAGKTGWDMQGPTDSYLSKIQIVDASTGLDGAGYGFTSSGNGVFKGSQFHIWNRTTGSTTNNPIAGLYLANGGNLISNSHFESGKTTVQIQQPFNTIIGSTIYAPDGTVALTLNSGYNTIIGNIGGNADYFFPNYTGIVFGPGSLGNRIDVMDFGANNGAIDFTNSGGSNIVRVRGTKAAGQTTYTGTPALTDTVDIRTDGAAGIALRSTPDDIETTYTPTVTSGGGSFTSVSATGTYIRVNGTKRVRVHITVTATSVGTASGTVTVTLPFAAANLQVAFGKAVQTSSKGLAGTINGTSLIFTDAAGAFPFPSNGEIAVFDFEYKIS